MAIEAYKIYVELVMDQAKIIGPLNEMLRAMERVEEQQKVIQTGLNEMAAGLRGNTRLADSLAAAMRGVADAAKAAGAATRTMRVPVGGASGATAPGVAPAAPTASGRNVNSPLLLSGPAPSRITSSPLLLGGPAPSRLATTGGAGGGGGRDGDVPFLSGPGGSGSRMPPINVSGGGAGGVPPGGGSPSGGKGFDPMHLVGAAATGSFVAAFATEAVKNVLSPAFQVQQERARIAAQTRQQPGDVDPIISDAFRQQENIKGTNVVANLEAYRMLYSLTQSKDETKALLPTFLRVGTALQANYPDAGTYDRQLEGVFKSAEFMGVISKTDPKTGATSVDAGGAQKVASMLLAFETVSNGAVDPNKFLAFLRSGGAAAANIDMSEMAQLLPVIQSMNPRGAGQGLKSFEQQFSSGKMSGGVMEMLTEMGIIKNPDLARKIGIGQFMLEPGALEEKTMMQAVTNPVEFYRQTLLPAVDKYLGKHYGATFTGGDVKTQHILESQVLQQLSSRIPGGTLLGELIRLQPLMNRDTSAVAAAGKYDLQGTLNSSPLTQINSFTGAVQGFLAIFGGPALTGALSGLGLLTNAIVAVEKVGQAHPVLAAKVTQDTLKIGTDAGLLVAGSLAAKYIATKFGSGTPLTSFGGLTSGEVFGGVAKAGLKGGLIGIAGSAASDVLLHEFDKYFPIPKKAQDELDSYSPLQTIGRDVRQIGRWLGIGSGPPKPPTPVATKANPMPVVIMNPGAIADGVNSHNAKLFSQEPAIHTGPSFAATPPWPGRPGGAP